MWQNRAVSHAAAWTCGVARGLSVAENVAGDSFSADSDLEAAFEQKLSGVTS